MTRSRGKVFVDRTVQGALVKRVIVHWCVFLLLSGLSIFALEYFMGEPGQTVQECLSTIWGKYAFFFLLMLAIVPSFIYDTLKLSNRFAGPIMRLKNSIRKLADGESVGTLRFRDGDFWNELSDDFNRVADRVKNSEA